MSTIRSLTFTITYCTLASKITVEEITLGASSLEKMIFVPPLNWFDYVE